MKKSLKGLRIGISIVMWLTILVAAAVGVLGHLGIGLTLDLWLAVTLYAVAAITLVLWVWFFCVSAPHIRNLTAAKAGASDNLAEQSATPASKRRGVNLKEQLVLHSMLLPGVVLVIIFMIVPMIGIVMAFENYNVAQGFFGSQWVGLKYFVDLFKRTDFWQATFNTVIIAVGKILFTSVLSIVFALLINEIRLHSVKKSVQTVLFLPYFLSWALLGNIMVDLFSYSGALNYVLSWFGIDPVYFIISNRWFRLIIVGSDVWKTIGYQIVVYLAAITNIDPALYEAAKIDGANSTQLVTHITLPSMMSMIVLMSILNIGNIMNAGFDQILVMYNPSVYETGDILDTMAYRIGLQQVGQYSVGTAIGLFKSIISAAAFSVSYFIAYKVKGYKIF